MKIAPKYIVFLMALCIGGCAPNTVYFSEGTVLGFRAEFKPDASEPVNSSLGYKRRIVTVVPPKEPASGSSDSLGQGIPHGEALSVVSTFTVNASIQQLSIENHFISGIAAQIATKDPSTAEQTVQAVVAPTLALLSPADQKRRQDLWGEIATMDPARAQRIADSLHLAPAPGKDAKALLNDAVLRAAGSPAALNDLEKAFKAVP